MKHVSILVPNGNVVLSSVVGAWKLLNATNQYLMASGKCSEPFFVTDLVGTKSSSELYGGLFEIRANKTIEEVKETDLVIITTVMGDFDEAIELNREFIPWILHQRNTVGAEVASLCTGAFLLAETGLVDGKPCSTHWVAAEEFRKRYPQVKLEHAKVITEVDGIYSSGGAYSFLNLLLYLIERHAGREAAIYCAKLFEVEFDRDNQNQFVIFEGQKDHPDEEIRKSQSYIEQNFNNKLSVEELAKRFAISRRNYVRRFKKATSNTPIEYIQRVRIEAAKNRLESTTFNVNEVMNEVGYADTKAFRSVFKKYTGLSPIEYRKRYNRSLAF